MSQGGPTITIVTRPTRLEALEMKGTTRSAAKFRLQMAHAQEDIRRNASTGQRNARPTSPEKNRESDTEFSDYELEHVTYHQSLQRVLQQLDFGLVVTKVPRDYVPSYDFSRSAVVIVIGQDGLVANVAKYVMDKPIVAVNPDPIRFDGVLLPFLPNEVLGAVKAVLIDSARIRDITLAEVVTNDGQKMLAFNDLFIGCKTHVSARYKLSVGGQSEAHSSSGLLVSTGAGATGWFSSVCNMVEGISLFSGEHVRPESYLQWDTRRLLWVVREPFKSKVTGSGLVAGVLEEGSEIVIESMMPTNGAIFSDGIEADSLEFNSGTIAYVKVARQVARLVVK